MATGADAPVAVVVLMVCRQIGISPLQLVRGEIDESDSAVAAPTVPANIRLERPSIQHTRIDSAAIRQALEAVLASDELPPPSIRLVADRLGTDDRQPPSLLPRTLPRYRIPPSRL